MSVLKRYRTPSPHQYVVNWQAIGKGTTPIVKKLSKRKGKFLEERFVIEINAISLGITMIDEMMMKSAKTKDTERYVKVINTTYDKLCSFTDTLFAICFLIKYDYKSQLEEDINREFMLLEKILESMGIEMREKERVRLYDRSKIKGVKYLEKLEDLAEFTYTKSTNMKVSYNLAFKLPLQTHVVRAFRMCYESNLIMMNTIENIDKRKQMLNDALSYLTEYEKVLWNLFSFCQLSNQVMEIWSGKYTEVIKLIKSIISYCNKERKKLVEKKEQEEQEKAKKLAQENGEYLDENFTSCSENLENSGVQENTE